MTPDSARLMARYNQWMNTRLVECATRLDPAELSKERGAFFGSIIGTLNHIAVADLIWLRRLAMHPAKFPGLKALDNETAFPRPLALRDTLSNEIAAFGALRQRIDGMIVDWADEVTAGHFASTLAYTNMAGATQQKPFWTVVQHLFNHQTHHRGQITTLFFQAGVDVGATDLLAMPMA